MKQEHWKNKVESHDFDAAREYLSLLADPPVAAAIAEDMADNKPLVWYKAKDLLRASRLDILSEGNAHVQKDLRRIKNGEKLSPILVVRGDWVNGFPPIIADGYHRICASYFLDENAEIPCRIV